MNFKPTTITKKLIIMQMYHTKKKEIFKKLNPFNSKIDVINIKAQVHVICIK